THETHPPPLRLRRPIEARLRPREACQNEPSTSFHPEPAEMSLGRRSFLCGGLSATVWALAARPAASDALDGFRVLEAGPASAQLAPAPAGPTRTLGYGGATPGPLLRLKLGQTLKARLVNRLDEPTTLHWRGLRIANAVAGIGD